MNKDKIESIKRHRILAIVTVLLFGILTFRLATLTIAKGDYYRELSENKRKKNIYVTAPRGEIRDRNGILLAGNTPTFTLQLLKDEMEDVKTETKNVSMLKVIDLLEEDAITYNMQFPILLNNLTYNSASEYLKTDISPINRVIQIINENNLLGEILDTYYHHSSNSNDFYYYPAQNIINSLEFASIEVPITHSIVDQKLQLSFIEGVDISNWKRVNGIPQDYGARASLIELAKDNETVFKKLLNHPINRGIIYGMLNDRDLQENILLEGTVNTYRDEYLNIKYSLMKTYDEISLETTAKQDFEILLRENSLFNLLKYETTEGGINIPATVLNLLSEKGYTNDYDIVIDEQIPYYFSKSDGDLDESIIINNIVKLLIDNKLVDDLLDIDGIPYVAQVQLINDGINTRISITNGFEYVPLKNLKAFNETYKIDESLSNEDMFNKVRTYYSIDTTISKYEALGIMNIYSEINKQGHLAYVPINFSYGLKDTTVAKIEEQLSQYNGFQISVEPVRYYPYGKIASHILGYMGKISQSSEIDEYVTKLKYTPDTLIGKTGIEESFQKNLYGTNGLKEVEVDVLGNTSNILKEVQPVPGDNVYLSIDLNIQKRAEEALEKTLRTIRTGGTFTSEWGDYDVVRSSDKGRPYINATSGAVMAVDIKTGEVLALASYPSYDPNIFATGISSADWDSLIPHNQNDPLAARPLYNVATQTAIQPGSTFKMITALTALEKGLSPDTRINDMGYIEIGDTRFGCWLWNDRQQVHGYLNMVQAIRDSCNYYFYTLAMGENLRTGEKLPVRIDIEDISNMASKFGLGSRTGMEINIPKEAASGVPNPQVKADVQKALLRRWLTQNIDRYYMGTETMSDELKNDIINKIVSWIDSDEVMTVKQLYDELAKLNINGTLKAYENKSDTLVDLIKFTYLNQSKWTTSDTLNITIGQGSNSYTLSQMTNYVASIANGGHKNKLTLINNIKNYNNTNTEYQNVNVSERIQLNNYDNLDPLKQGMYQASLAGLNKNVFGEFPIKVAIKTGTAERSGINPVTRDTYDSFAYEVAFAPYDDPQIAIAVLIFQGGAGSNCSPVVREVVAEYMGLYKTMETDDLPIELDIIP